jgi:AraC-like DNA-binding protein
LLDCVNKGGLVNWADLAVDCGYFDQSHLIRDSRVFAGLTPIEYLNSRHANGLPSIAKT